MSNDQFKLLKFSCVVVLIGISLGLATYVVLKSPQANAAVQATDWKSGQIIDDAVFYDSSDMTVEQVQNFLASKVPVCDTNGIQKSEYGGGTRAQYGASRGYPAPFVCLKDYYENPSTRENNLSGRSIPAGAISSAQIIKNAASAHNVSVRALLVIIQKESPGPLITDTWPFANQYRNAMGYGCPDTAPCDPQYEGFSNQVNNAARQFSLYKNNPANYRYKANQNNAVAFNPSASCGTAPVYIKNTATAGLYNHTPYQPNQAALNNMYGSGDSCSAYGNRNFWRMFNDWFGNTLANTCSTTEVPTKAVSRLYNPKTYTHLYTNYICESEIAMRVNGFVYENFVYYTSNPEVAGNIPIHRLYNPKTYSHFWTTTQADIDAATQYAGYRYEGVAYYVSDPQAPGAIPVHRLYNPKTYLHLWATTQVDIDAATQYAGYRYEGVAYYVSTQSW